MEAAKARRDLMNAEVSKLVDSYWVMVPVGLTLGCLLIGGLAALTFGRLGEMLGFIAGGSASSRLWGSRIVSGLGGSGLGAALGWGLGKASTSLGPETLLTAYWAAIGLVLGAFMGSRRRRTAPGPRFGMMARTSLVVAQSTGMDLETFLCLFLGALAGMVGGVGFGVALAIEIQGHLLLGGLLGGLLGVGLGLTAGTIASHHGHVGWMVAGMVLGSAVCGTFGWFVSSLGRDSGAWISGALTGMLAGGGFALILAERLYWARSQQGEQLM